MPKSKSKKMGRPEIPIDVKALDSLCQMHCTLEEIAFFFKTSVDTIERRVKAEYKITFAEYFKKTAVGGRLSLRRALYASALGSPAKYDDMGNVILPAVKPNLTAQIWLSKQPEIRGGLGFSDRISHQAGDSSFETMIKMIKDLETEKQNENK